MGVLIVVNDPKHWPLAMPGTQVVDARAYLTEPEYAGLRGARVFNLCRSYRYQSTGYYVSLLAAARGHKPVPDVGTIQDLKLPAVMRGASEDLDELIQKSLKPVQSDRFVLSIYFGRNLAKRYDELSQRLFGIFQAPFLRAQFLRQEKSKRWQLMSIGPIAASEIPDDHRDFVVTVATEYFSRRTRTTRRRGARYDLAILRDPKEPEPPSDERALRRFEKAAESLRLDTEFIGKDDYGRLGEYDALFIRETTAVLHHTYRFARRAAYERLVVVDDPESILKCTNKVFLAELLHRNRIPTPRTMIVHRGNLKKVPAELGLPCILKKPDSSFSQGVLKTDTERDFQAAVNMMLERSELLIAQEFLPTPFDWRVGVFDRQPLYACKYFMAREHWQIIKRSASGEKTSDGLSQTLPVEHAPTDVVRTAVRAANLIGDSLYGVDIKQVGKRLYVIEVNDNPSIEAGVEDAILKEELYLRILRVILRRIEESKHRGYSV